MEILGHSRISMTLDTYSHVMPAAMREAAEKISAVLWDQNRESA
jgi:integrase